MATQVTTRSWRIRSRAVAAYASLVKSTTTKRALRSGQISHLSLCCVNAAGPMAYLVVALTTSTTDRFVRQSANVQTSRPCFDRHASRPARIDGHGAVPAYDMIADLF